MSGIADNRVLELFGCSPRHARGADWRTVIRRQQCPFTNSKCYKVRKSQSTISIGTCSVRYGAQEIKDVIICPKRLLERRQVFVDCMHLLSLHEPGNELHVVPEVTIPGGSVDYFLVSALHGKPRDFVAIEFQTLDTTGTIWPERQRLLHELRIPVKASEVASKKGFGMNWKMTAKTILVQLHHKVSTLEHMGKRLVLVIQDYLFDYLQREFHFGHVNAARLGDAIHIHSYLLNDTANGFRLAMAARVSTDSAGVAKCLGIQSDTNVEIDTILAELARKMSPKTLLSIPGM